MSLLISSVFTYDEDAGNYIQAVETADAQALEPATRQAINNFVLGCKADGIWSAIKASCILAGARTLAGALQPLVGTAPTNNGFIGIGTDYVRKTGLVGNGSNKYLNSNRNNNVDPQNSNHNVVYVSTATTLTSVYMCASTHTIEIGDNNFGKDANGLFVRSRTSTAAIGYTGATTGLIGINRSNSANYIFRYANNNNLITQASQTPFSSNVCIFATRTGLIPVNARLAFYSIGESLDLALLDTRVTALINAFGASIP